MGGGKDESIFRNTIFYLLIFLVIIGIVSIFNNNNEPTEKITNDEFYENLEDGNVKPLSMQPEQGVYLICRATERCEEGEAFCNICPISEYEQAKIVTLLKKQGIDKFEVKPAEKQVAG